MIEKKNDKTFVLFLTLTVCLVQHADLLLFKLGWQVVILYMTNDDEKVRVIVHLKRS